jgi:hypothetical protein
MVSFNTKVKEINPDGTSTETFTKIWDGLNPTAETFINIIHHTKTRNEYQIRQILSNVQECQLRKIKFLLKDLLERSLARSARGIINTQILPYTNVGNVNICHYHSLLYLDNYIVP